MDGSWEDHAKWNNSDDKGKNTYGFTHICDIKQKETMDKQNTLKMVTRGEVDKRVKGVKYMVK